MGTHFKSDVQIYTLMLYESVIAAMIRLRDKQPPCTPDLGALQTKTRFFCFWIHELHRGALLRLQAGVKSAPWPFHSRTSSYARTALLQSMARHTCQHSVPLPACLSSCRVQGSHLTRVASKWKEEKLRDRLQATAGSGGGPSC